MANTAAQAQYDADLAALNALSGIEKIKAKEKFDLKYPTGRPVDNTAGTEITGNALLDAITEAIIKAHPPKTPGGASLTEVRDLFRAGKMTDALQKLYQTDYYKEYYGQKYTNDQLKVNKPEAYENEIKNTWMPYLRKYAQQSGIKIDEASLESIARSAYDMGLSPSAPATIELFAGINPATGKSYVTGIVGGGAVSYRDNLATGASDYGVAFDAVAAAQAIALGKTTEQEQMDLIKQHAIGAFPAWEKQLTAGLSVKQIAQPYINTYANLLEMPSAEITLDDPLLKKALQGNDPTTPAGMPLWQFERQIKADPRYMYTTKARADIDGVAHGVLRDMGLAY